MDSTHPEGLRNEAKFPEFTLSEIRKGDDGIPSLNRKLLNRACHLDRIMSQERQMREWTVAKEWKERSKNDGCVVVAYITELRSAPPSNPVPRSLLPSYVSAMKDAKPFQPPHILAAHSRTLDPRQRRPVPPPPAFTFGQKGDFFKHEFSHVADICSITAANRGEWYETIRKQVCTLRE
jgi:hypothetical protein